MSGTTPPRKRHPLAVALMGALMLTFLVLGVGGRGRLTDIFAAQNGDAVAVAGRHTVTTRQFKNIFEQQKRTFEEQTHQQLTLEFLVQNGADRQILNQLAEQKAFSELLTRAGIVPANSLVDDEIKRQPAFFDRVTGKFSPAQFTQALGQLGLTPRDLQSEIKDEIGQRHFTFALQAGFKAPRIVAALQAVRGLENRDISFFPLGQGAVPMPTPPTDAQLLAFMKEHAAELTIPQTRVISLVRFSAKAAEPTVTLDPAAVQKEFDFKKDSLSKPETRTLVQIPVKSAAQGAEAAARMARGEDPVAIAKAYGVEPISYADKPLSAIADRKLGAAAFALKAGETKGPVQGDLGLSAVKVISITPGVTATLESARPQIEAELRAKAAQDKVYDQSQKFDDLRQGGASVAVAAQKVGAQVVTIGPIVANGTDEHGQRNPLLTDKVLKSAFDLAQGAETDLEDDGQGEYYALKVERVIPPALPSLADKRPALAAYYMRFQFQTALKAKVDALVQRVKNGESIDAVAASAGGHVFHQVGMQRIAAQQYQAMGNDFLERIFGAKPGDVFGVATQQGVFVARLDAVRPGDATTMARITDSIRPRASEDYGKDFEFFLRAAAAKAVKVTTNLDLARRAIGVDPATLPKPGAKPGDKPAAPAAKSGGLAQ